MAEGNGKNGQGQAEGAQPDEGFQAQVVAQYVKDMSFENPNISKLIAGSKETPKVNLEVSVGAKKMGPDLFESAINFKAEARDSTSTIYLLEVVYAGLIRLKNIPEQALEPFLLIQCPTLVFPFLRRLVADISREGGFPPLMLDPIDFAALYMRHQQERAAGAGGKAAS